MGDVNFALLNSCKVFFFGIFFYSGYCFLFYTTTSGNFLTRSIMGSFFSVMVTSLMLSCAVAPVLATTSSIRPDGTVLVDGVPFFPMGFYDIKNINDMKNVAASSFNCSWTRYQDVSNFGQFLDSCGAHKFRVIVACNSEDVVAEGLVTQYKNNPGVFSWDAEDDAEDPTYRNFDQVRTKSIALKTADPTHARYISLTANSNQRRADVRKWVEISEMSGIQMYPIGDVTWDRIVQTNALRVCAQRMCYYADTARAAQRSIIGNLQSHSWGSRAEANGRYPTAAEIRNMTYAGLIAGLKGIVYYTYNGITGVTDHWNELKLLAPDVKRMAPALMDGTWSRLTTGDADLFAAHWVYRDTLWVIAVNTSYSSSKTVSLTLPTGYTAAPVTVASRLASGLTLQNRVLSGTLAAQATYASYIPKTVTTGMQGRAPGRLTDVQSAQNRQVNTLYDIRGRNVCNECEGSASPAGVYVDMSARKVVLNTNW